MNFRPCVTGRSLEYKLNRIGARTEPWGRPLRWGLQELVNKADEINQEITKLISNQVDALRNIWSVICKKKHIENLYSPHNSDSILLVDNEEWIQRGSWRDNLFVIHGLSDSKNFGGEAYAIFVISSLILSWQRNLRMGVTELNVL